MMTPEEASKWKSLFAENKTESIIAFAIRAEFSQIRQDIKFDLHSLVSSHLKPTFWDALRANKGKFGIAAVLVGTVSAAVAIGTVSSFSTTEKMELIRLLMEKLQAVAKCKS